MSRLKLCVLWTKFCMQQPSLRVSQQNLASEEAKICLSKSSFIILELWNFPCFFETASLTELRDWFGLVTQFRLAQYERLVNCASKMMKKQPQIKSLWMVRVMNPLEAWPLKDLLFEKVPILGRIFNIIKIIGFNETFLK